MKAGLIAADTVPWTVSIHDLDLIAELAENPAVFLLYLRRRRHPEATVIYTAPDELDLYLYFLESGLYVDEHPDRLREKFSFLLEPTAADYRRWERQQPRIITSRTDKLDEWFFGDYLRVRHGRPRLPSSPVYRSPRSTTGVGWSCGVRARTTRTRSLGRVDDARICAQKGLSLESRALLIGVLYEQIPETLSLEDRAAAENLQPVTALRRADSVRLQIRGQRAQPRRKRKPRRR